MIKELLNKGNYSLRNLSRVNILVGKNGCGKSTLLKKVEEALLREDNIGKVRYITPERGGQLQYQPNVEQNIINNVNWLPQTRRANQFIQFREQSMVHYRKLELLYLREIEKDLKLRQNRDYTFDTTISKINSLLDHVELRREDSDFGVYGKVDGQKRRPEEISSGESELISLAIECLSFNKESPEGKVNFLFLDEPDVHLHPDLQTRLVHFLRELVDAEKFQIVVATHSTAFLGAFRDYKYLHIAFMTFGGLEFNFRPITEVYRKILPVFGAHPLSNIFNQAPILLVEGEDDERIWQQAVRTARGRLRLFPCSVDGVGDMNDYEQEVKHIIEAVYDSAKAYSLRDRDEGPEDVQDLGALVRFKLSCRAAENLLLSDDVLHSLGTSWGELKAGIENWLNVNQKHKHFSLLNQFQNEGFERKSFDLKEVRNDLMGIMGSSKPWEVAVGQVIANLDPESLEKPDSLASYLGPKIVTELLSNRK
ncbi:MAG: AAA family ATPase [Desulfomonilaceae bacterium]